ncbi:uncharacterized protein LOC113505474 [Trichoplusia ni]|uniref:Uncharacterized protein LOC113505474 n=1 Tax=Trichoplusia ni TaxID=7111 RepID=A0A7E5WUN8_TRINI|nr:uncharacterized protein LOC113505474 [Trichoplusia ni]
MISESSDPPPELQQDVQDDSQLNSNGESSNDFEVAQYTQQNDSEGDQYIEQDESVEHEYNEQNESTDFNEQNDSISQDNGENETICNEFSVQNEDGCDGSEFIQDNSCEDNVFNEQNDCNCEQEDCNTDQQSPSSSIEGEGQVEQLEGGMPPPDFVDSACQTDRDTDTPLQVAAAAAPIEYCEVNPMNTIELVPAMAHLEAQAIVAEPQYFAGAEGENLNVQRVECGDGYGYFVILN